MSVIEKLWDAEENKDLVSAFIDSSYQTKEML